jgi:murein tripeptide amidase MpaA
LETIGQSFEGVDMTVIKICRGGGGCDNGKPDMYIEGGIHAREWISPATVMWLIKELVEGSGAIGGEHEDLVDNLNWHILPVTNPDGYAYTQVDRYWRKTRSVNDGNTCDGVDPNRNWDYMWNTGGSSANSCSDAYMGPGPMSEVEVSL